MPGTVIYYAGLALLFGVLAWLMYTSMRDCPTGKWMSEATGAYKCDPKPP